MAKRVPNLVERAEQAAATQALELCQRKGNLPGARESLGYLTQYAHT